MLALGYRPVGKDFPVFLHPQTHEEYALARTERKVAPGYQGFVFHASPDVTLEEDLKRRDLTINAMAQDAAGNIIDPFHGQEDLKNKLFRHVSLAFAEDPVRLLRVARFAARFSDFNIHFDTLQLMCNMVANGEIAALVPERVWQEWEKAMAENAPQRFFKTLAACGALDDLFPSVGRNQLGIYALENATTLSSDPMIRLAAFFYPVNVEVINNLTKRYRIPNSYHDLATLVSKYHTAYFAISKRTPEKLFFLLESLDAFRRPARFQNFLLVCRAIYLDHPYSPSSALTLERVFAVANAVTAEPFVAQGLTGKAIGEAMREARIKAINDELLNS